MSKEKEIKLKGPWKQVQTAIWLIGLAVLAATNNWWPGILILLAVSLLSQAAIQSLVPGSVEEELPEPELPKVSVIPAAAPQPPVQQTTDTSPPVEHPTQRLPSECPKCGGPIRGYEVHWTGPESADCPYCGANLPLRK